MTTKPTITADDQLCTHTLQRRSAPPSTHGWALELVLALADGEGLSAGRVLLGAPVLAAAAVPRE